mgnify:CR=1 FL=1
MAFDWTEYLKLANYIQQQGNKSILHKEAAYRSAVSRAYYAAFCYARNCARDNHGFKPRYNRQDHEDLPNFFVSIQKSNVADILDELRQWRNSCDYDDISPSNLTMMSVVAISNANYIISNVR